MNTPPEIDARFDTIMDRIGRDPRRACELDSEELEFARFYYFSRGSVIATSLFALAGKDWSRCEAEIEKAMHVPPPKLDDLVSKATKRIKAGGVPKVSQVAAMLVETRCVQKFFDLEIERRAAPQN